MALVAAEIKTTVTSHQHIQSVMPNPVCIASDICPTYTGKQEQSAYTIEEGYKHQIRSKSISNSNWTSEQRWQWFKHTQYYTKQTLDKYWSQLKKNKPAPIKPVPAPPTTYRAKRKIAEQVAQLLFKYKYDDKYDK